MFWIALASVLLTIAVVVVCGLPRLGPGSGGNPQVDVNEDEFDARYEAAHEARLVSRMDERVSLRGVDPSDVLRGLLSTSPLDTRGSEFRSNRLSDTVGTTDAGRDIVPGPVHVPSSSTAGLLVDREQFDRELRAARGSVERLFAPFWVGIYSAVMSTAAAGLAVYAVIH